MPKLPTIDGWMEVGASAAAPLGAQPKNEGTGQHVEVGSTHRFSPPSKGMTVMRKRQNQQHIHPV